MHNDACPPFSRAAYNLYIHLSRRTGCMRLRPLLRDERFTREDLCVAINELAERCRITITLRPPRDRTEAGLADIDRITVTTLGRSQVRAMRPADSSGW